MSHVISVAVYLAVVIPKVSIPWSNLIKVGNRRSRERLASFKIYKFDNGLLFYRYYLHDCFDQKEIRCQFLTKVSYPGFHGGIDGYKRRVKMGHWTPDVKESL